MRQRMQLCQTTMQTMNPVSCSGNMFKQVSPNTLNPTQFFILNGGLWSSFFVSANDCEQFFHESWPPAYLFFTSALTRRTWICQNFLQNVKSFWTSAGFTSTQRIYWAKWPLGKLGHFDSCHYLFQPSCSYHQCLCINVYSTTKTKNSRMIQEMWANRHQSPLTSYQRERLYPMAWRLLNKILPGYLPCFSTCCSILEF